MLRTLSTVDQGLVEVANSLLAQLHVPFIVESLEDITANVFIILFEGLYGESLPELLPNPQTKQDDIHNCQMVIDVLADKILNTSLSHITGKDIVEGDRTSVANLLEILTGLFEFLTEKIEFEKSRDEEQEEDVFLGCQDEIDQLVNGIKNLPPFQKGESSTEGSLKASWQDFMDSENLKEPDPETDLQLSPVKTDDDDDDGPQNLTFSIEPPPYNSPQPPPTTTEEGPPPSPPPPPLLQEDKSTITDFYLSEIDPTDSNQQLTTAAENPALKTNRTAKVTPPRKIARKHVAVQPAKNPSSNDNKKGPSQPQSSKGNRESAEINHVKLPRQEEEKESDEISVEEVTELLQTYSNNRTTDELLDMIDVTLKQLEAETRYSVLPDGVPQKKQVHFEEPASLKKVRKSKAPVYTWQPRPGGWKNNKKLKFVRRNYAEDLAEICNEMESKKKANKTAANEKEKELLKITGGFENCPNIGNTISAVKKKSRKPNMKARVYNTTKEVKAEDLLPALLEEFPCLQLSMESWRELWKKSITQLEYLTRSYRNTRQKRDKSQQQIDDAENRQRILYDIIKKELSHTERMKEMKESKMQRFAVKNRLHEKRMTSARARRYYNEFSAQMRSRMMRKKTKEEQIFKRLFKDSLQIQRERIQELQKYFQEIRSRRSHELQNEIDSMENYYHDQFQMVADSIKRQRSQKMAQEAAQKQLINSMKRDLRRKMEQEVRDIQEELCRDEDDAYFRELDAEKVKRELQLANYVFKQRPRSYIWNSNY